MEVLQIKDLDFSYDGIRQVLKHVNLMIHQGERIAVLGANGAGKSTLFLNMNGVLTPDSGEILYKGQFVLRKNIHALRQHVGIVFQEADQQIIASTVMAEVSFGPMNLRLSKDEVIQRVDEALDYMDLSGYKYRAPHYLSGGEKKRVSIADIIAMKPEVIIFDEPTASLDPLSSTMLEEVLAKLSGEGKTLLISTHDVDFAYRWARRVLVFSEGELIADAAPEVIFKDAVLLEKAHLKRPMMLDVWETLISKDLVDKSAPYPRCSEDFVKYFQSC